MLDIKKIIDNNFKDTNIKTLKNLENTLVYLINKDKLSCFKDVELALDCLSKIRNKIKFITFLNAS
ncbi:MAG: hypothetical protein EHM58_04405 [Ignavibacteriae bacterium]|nr:MAG: hypothetical protein EHM58_04405 [Ignavibacteriota bacterium]